MKKHVNKIKQDGQNKAEIKKKRGKQNKNERQK